MAESFNCGIAAGLTSSTDYPEYAPVADRPTMGPRFWKLGSTRYIGCGAKPELCHRTSYPGKK